MLSSEIEKLAKVSLIGYPATGKTTLAKLLAQNEIDRLYFPTHGLDLKTIRLDDYILRLWDLGGQQSYLKTYSRDYLLGSDIIFVVTDSTPKNVLNSRELINYACYFVGKECPIIAIANKQDLVKSEGRMDYKRVEDILHIKTYGLTAIDPSERLKMMNIIKNELIKIAIRRRRKK